MDYSPAIRELLDVVFIRFWYVLPAILLFWWISSRVERETRRQRTRERVRDTMDAKEEYIGEKMRKK